MERGSHRFSSGAAAQIESFVRSRLAADAICGSALDNLHLFDAHCAGEFPGESGLTQGMVDSWCLRRPTESAGSCRSRCQVVASLVSFLRGRGETDVEPPDLPRPQGTPYVPHAFTDEELDEFFRVADSLELTECMDKATRTRTMRTVPVIFRLLLSSGIRTCEARLLGRDLVDLEGGVLRIVEGKGRSERLVALHPSMLPVMRDYDEAMESVYPGRAYFFPNGPDGHISRHLLARWFRDVWSQVSEERATAYELRHHFATTCINELVGRGVEGLRDLEWVSKALGHTSVEETMRAYYHIVPALHRLLQERCGDTFDDVVPGVV